MKHWNYKESKPRNKRQAMNFPVQCLGATITRRALELAIERGLKPIFPVHDEIYFKTTLDRLDTDVACARKCMIEAAFDAVGEEALMDYPIKVGEVEVTTCNKVPKHSGGEATAELIERNLLLLRTLPDNYAPFKSKKKSSRSKKEEAKKQTDNSVLEGFFE
jgi:hypothetical protein